jgi:Ni/Fe-hydrogenase subunit HybB-like protein
MTTASGESQVKSAPAKARQQMEHDIIAAMHKPRRGYWLAVFLCGAVFVAGLFGAWGYQIARGLGVAGIMHPVSWGVYITNSAAASTGRRRR